MFVDRLFNLGLDAVETSHEEFALAGGEVESLALGIVKEGVFFDSGGKRCLVDEVGVKHESDDVGGELNFIHVDADELSRGEADHGAFLVVVGLTAVEEGAPGVVFEKDGIDAIVDDDVVDGAHGLLEVDYRHQGVEGLESV